MTYATQEASIQDGAPYYLYQFNVDNAAADIYRFTDYPVTISYDGDDYNPLAMTHTEIKRSEEVSKNSIKTTIPLGAEFADLFKGWVPDFVVTVTVRRGHIGASDTLVNWKGRFAGSKFKKQTLELNCESVFTSLRRAGIKARYQRNCRHVLYDNQCTVDKNDFAVAGTVSDVSGLILTISEASSKDDGWFIGGIIEFGDGSSRLITAHSTDQITINRANRYLVDQGDSGWGSNWGNFWGGGGDLDVTLYPGCDRTLQTCIDKFDNVVNQGGFKWIPVKNPMGGSSII
jgi:uncharacterized phage protein (TIGR02218 family)